MNKHLLALDFDGSMARTFDDSPNGMNVNIASRKAILDVFGEKGLNVYDNIGGLKGREPGELVRLVQDSLAETGSRRDLTSQFIDAKLSYLVPEISDEWPRLTSGMAELNDSVKRGEIPVDLAVVSSGHDAFISRILEIHGINAILVTSDILRERGVEERHKPDPYQLEEAQRQWLAKRLDGELLALGGYVERDFYKANIAYAGDDPIKDGEMAERARVAFIYMPFTKDGFSPQLSKGQIYLSDFHALRRILLREGRRLSEGGSFTEVFFGRKDIELFPPVPEGKPWMKLVRERGL